MCSRSDPPFEHQRGEEAPSGAHQSLSKLSCSLRRNRKNKQDQTGVLQQHHGKRPGEVKWSTTRIRAVAFHGYPRMGDGGKAQVPRPHYMGGPCICLLGIQPLCKPPPPVFQHSVHSDNTYGKSHVFFFSLSSHREWGSYKKPSSQTDRIKKSHDWKLICNEYIFRSTKPQMCFIKQRSSLNDHLLQRAFS